MRYARGILLLNLLCACSLAGCSIQGNSKISPPSAVPQGRFGAAVATTGAMGAIGSPGAAESGVVFLYDLGSGGKLVAEVLPETAIEGDDFGSALALDEELMVVGSPLHEHEGFIAGAAFVYHRNESSGEWLEEAILASDIAGDLDYFASSLSLGVGRIIVGSPGDDMRGANAGAAYVFADPNLGWALEAKLLAPDAGAGDRCGTSVAIEDDRVLLGCPYGYGSAIGTGAAYLFRHSDSGYILDQKFVPPSEDTGQLFGSAVALEGGRVFVGAPGVDTEYPDGAVHIFQFDGTAWQSGDVLSAGDRVASRGFGAVLSVDDDILAVGAQRMEGEHLSPGSAYVFQNVGGRWDLQSRLRSHDVDRADGFGSSVSIRNGHVIVGAAGDSEKAGNAGAAYQFAQSGTDWK